MLMNNSIKLFIVSATMGDDEKIYKKFYKCIDNDLQYPINQCLLEKKTIDNNYNYTTNIIDNRIHIAAPGKITLFNVTEIYLDNNSKVDDYESAEIEGIKTILEILTKIDPDQNSKGDILFFSITKKKILNIVEKLNKIIPSHCIAIPLYSEVNIK